MTKRGTAALLPGVILPDNGSEARVGLLKSVQDQRRNSSSEASIPFTDFQQLLLAKIAAEHQPDTGKHDADNRINGAEIGHAVLVAASVDHTIVHLTVHQYIGDIAWQAGPSLLSAKVAETGATDVLTKNGLRKNQEAILPLYRVAALFIVKANQQPWPLGSDPLDLSAGFTYAAIQTQVGQPKPDLGANFDNLQLAYEYGNTSE